MKQVLLFALIVLGPTLQARGQTASPSKAVLLGFHELESQIISNTRTLRVLLPADYHTGGNQTRYPVLFLNDAQCLFDGATCPFSNGEWRVDETVDSLLNRKEVDPFIVVGIDNIGSRNRGMEYLPWEDIHLDPPIPHPMGSRYPEFLLDEVLPFVQDRYRISTRREDVGLGGASYGALITLYTYLEESDRIGFLLLESPSFYVNNQAVLKKVEGFDGVLPRKVHLGVGTNELGLDNCDESNADNRMAVNDVTSLHAMLLSKGMDENRIHVDVDPCATHSERSYAGRFPGAVTFLMGH